MNSSPYLKLFGMIQIVIIETLIFSDPFSTDSGAGLNFVCLLMLPCFDGQLEHEVLAFVNKLLCVHSHFFGQVSELKECFR